MKWFRRNIKTGSRLALFALALQFVLSFGHFHFNTAQAAPDFRTQSDFVQLQALPADAVSVVDPDPQTGGAEVIVGAEGNDVQFTVTFKVLRVVPFALKLIEEAPAKTHFTLA